MSAKNEIKIIENPNDIWEIRFIKYNDLRVHLIYYFSA